MYLFKKNQRQNITYLLTYLVNHQVEHQNKCVYINSIRMNNANRSVGG